MIAEKIVNNFNQVFAHTNIVSLFSIVFDNMVEKILEIRFPSFLFTKYLESAWEFFNFIGWKFDFEKLIEGLKLGESFIGAYY